MTMGSVYHSQYQSTIFFFFSVRDSQMPGVGPSVGWHWFSIDPCAYCGDEVIFQLENVQTSAVKKRRKNRKTDGGKGQGF